MSNSLDNWKNNPSFNWNAFEQMKEARHYNNKFPAMNIPPCEITYHCVYCGNQDLETNLIKCLDGQLRHECCIEFKDELYKNMKS